VRILLLSHQYPPETGFGGIASYTVTMSKALSARSHEVHVLTCWDSKEPSDTRDGEVFVHRRRNVRIPGLAKALRVPGVRQAADAVRVPPAQMSANPVLRWKTALTCYREYRRLGLEFDVVESPDWMAEGLLIALRGGVPLVVDLKGNLLTYTRSSGFEMTWHGKVSVAMERRTIERATIVTSPSMLTAEELVAAGWRNVADPTVIRRPVDVSTWTASSATATKPMILQVGRREAIKAPDVVLRAAARLKSTVPDLEVTFVGGTYGDIDGVPAGDRVDQLAAELGVNVNIVGYAPWTEMREWYERCRVVTIASRYDNFPNVGLEAMASGRPVVCSTRTGLAEMAHSGSNAIAVCPPDDDAALAAALAPYLCDAGVATAAGEQARRQAWDECRPDVIAEQRERVYQAAMATTGATTRR
jgi:glycosyltransferase involved in cell wall biosynthesis